MKINKNIRTVLAFAVTGILLLLIFFYSNKHRKPVCDLRTADEGDVHGIRCRCGGGV